MLKVALIFHSTCSDNLGVGALTVSQVDILRRAAAALETEIRIRVIDWKDPRPPYVTGPDIDIHRIRARDILKPWKYARLIADADLVIDAGGGDSFADIYGGGRLERMLAMRFIAHGLGRPLVMSPQTIGPFNGGWSRRAAGLTLRACAIVSVRDDLSAEVAGRMGRKELVVASDMALRLPYDPPAPRGRAGNGPLRVGINVSGLLMSGGYTQNNMFGLRVDYTALMRALIIDFLAMEPSVELHFVPHVISEKHPLEDDRAACRILAEEFPGTVLAPAFAEPSEAKSYIAGMDFFMGARMHACIAALSAGVPVVPMAYSRKFAGLFGSLGYDHTVDCTAQDLETIRGAVLSAFAARNKLAGEAEQARAAGLERLDRYENALQELMAMRLLRGKGDPPGDRRAWPQAGAS